jgi:hypothetical protein
MFRQMNVDGDSHLSKTELCAAMAKLCPGAGIPELNTMYGMLDANGDLHISEKEFVTQMQALTRDMPSLTTDTAQHLSYRARQIDRAWHTIISNHSRVQAAPELAALENDPSGTMSVACQPALLHHTEQPSEPARVLLQSPEAQE